MFFLGAAHMMSEKSSIAPNLATPTDVGSLRLPNCIVMAPLTRSRAGAGNVPTQLNALYYAQRASAGLIISEATQICPEGQGYVSTPGIHSAEQIEGWKCVTGAVHVLGGRIVLQLWLSGAFPIPPSSQVAHCRWRPRRLGPQHARDVAAGSLTRSWHRASGYLP